MAGAAPAASVGRIGADASIDRGTLGCTGATGGATSGDASAGEIGAVRLEVTVAVPTESDAVAEGGARACVGAAAWRGRCAKAATPMTSANAANPPIA